jgi:hypothetical protein
MSTRTILRYADLKQRKIVNNWPSLLRWIAREGFPAGFRLGPQQRAWFEDEVDSWLESRRIDDTGEAA